MESYTETPKPKPKPDRRANLNGMRNWIGVDEMSVVRFSNRHMNLYIMGRGGGLCVLFRNFRGIFRTKGLESQAAASYSKSRSLGEQWEHSSRPPSVTERLQSETQCMAIIIASISSHLPVSRILPVTCSCQGLLNLASLLYYLDIFHYRPTKSREHRGFSDQKGCRYRPEK